MLERSQKFVKSVDDYQRNKNKYVVMMNRFKYEDRLEDSKRVLVKKNDYFLSYDTFSNLYELQDAVKNGVKMWEKITSSFKNELLEDPLEKEILNYEKKIIKSHSTSVIPYKPRSITTESVKFPEISPTVEVYNNGPLEINTVTNPKHQKIKVTKLSKMMRKRNKKLNTLKPIRYLDNSEILWAPYPEKHRKKFVYSEVVSKQGFLEDSTNYNMYNSEEFRSSSVTSSDSHNIRKSIVINQLGDSIQSDTNYKKYYPKEKTLPTILDKPKLEVLNKTIKIDVDTQKLSIRVEPIKIEEPEIIDPLAELKEKVRKNRELLLNGEHPILKQNNNLNDTVLKELGRKIKSKTILNDRELIKMGSDTNIERRMTPIPYHTVKDEKPTLVHNLPHDLPSGTPSEYSSYTSSSYVSYETENKVKPIPKKKISKMKQLREMMNIYEEDMINSQSKYRKFPHKRELIPANKEIQSIMTFVTQKYDNDLTNNNNNLTVVSCPPPQIKNKTTKTYMNYSFLPLKTGTTATKTEISSLSSEGTPFPSDYTTDDENEFENGEEGEEEKEKEEENKKIDCKFIYKKRDNYVIIKSNKKVRELTPLSTSTSSCESESLPQKFIIDKNNIDEISDDNKQTEEQDIKSDINDIKSDSIVNAIISNNENEENMKYCNENRNLLNEHGIELPKLDRQIKKLPNSIPKLSEIIEFSKTGKKIEDSELKERMNLIFKDKTLCGEVNNGDNDEYVDFLGNEGKLLSQAFETDKKVHKIEQRYKNQY